MRKITEAGLLDYVMAAPAGQPMPAAFSEQTSRKVRAFHAKIPGYEPTRLTRLRHLAETWGVSDVWIKDESTRFGLGAFKALGGSYAMARWLCQKSEKDIDTIAYEELTGPDLRKRLGRVTFAAATDGNHGRGVAWAARQLGQSAMIYMPHGSVRARVENIRAQGATVEVTEANYDDTVRLCWQTAQENGWVVFQDTAWEGYTDIPTWIMQGYTTMCSEVFDQIAGAEKKPPTHVFLQAGVGAFAAAVVGCLADRYRQQPPQFVIVEPREAACMLKSAAAGDHGAHSVGGELKTIMAGLACGEPNPLAWHILRDFGRCYIRCDDAVAANGIRILAHPLEGDDPIEAGESGAVGIGLLDQLCLHPELNDLRSRLEIGPRSRLLFFNTEGATDPQNYREILWYGKYCRQR